MNLKVLAINILLFFLNESFAYKIVTLSELCPDGLMKSFNKIIHNSKEVHLEDYDQSAALVQFSWNSSSFKRTDECRFRVIASNKENKNRNRGVFVLIRRLNLRKNPHTNECYDWIRFKFGDKKSEKFCEQLNSSIDDPTKTYFGESGGVIEVYISLDKYRPFAQIDDTLDVELVFTANEDCGPGDLIRCFNNTCISNALANDKIINCPPPYCTDEGSKCPLPPNRGVQAKEATTSNTDIVISALTSLIFTLVGVGSCLWLCWHIKDCFLPEQESQVRSSVNGTSNSNRRVNNTRSTAFNSPADNFTSATGSTTNSGRGTAPPLEDKDDSPPSYETLFPHLANSNENK